MLTFVKGTPAEKRLASTFITRFFKHFPKLQDQAIDALLDLCEDEDNAVCILREIIFMSRIESLVFCFQVVLSPLLPL